MKKIFTIITVIILIPIIIYSINYFLLQMEMDKVIENDRRNKGINVSVHYQYYVNLSTLIYNLKDISKSNSMLDVFRVFLQFAQKMKSKNFDQVYLSFRGKNKFKITGTYFKKLGKEYSWQNPLYTMRTFSENLFTLKGSKAYPSWTGGVLGVTTKQMEQFNNFNKEWWIDDLILQ